MSHIFSTGNPRCLTIDLQKSTVHVNLAETSTGISDLWKKQFQQMPEVMVCLSGGLDSQFSAHLAKHYCSKAQAVTFAYYWNQNLVNAHDVTAAMQFAEKIDLDHQIIDVDIKRFLESELLNYSREFRTGSPQIAVHLYAIHKHLSDYNMPVMMGGEVPLVACKEKTAVLPFRWPSTKDGNFSHANLYNYVHLVLPYLALSSRTGCKIIRDPFLMSSQIYYQGFMHNMSVIEKNRAIVELSDPLRREISDYKELYYKSFGYDFLVPLKKRTGFESIKTHLAIETGIYNEFDIRYRFPLTNNAQKDASLGRPVFNSISDRILEAAQNIINKHELTFCNTYTFDW